MWASDPPDMIGDGKYTVFETETEFDLGLRQLNINIYNFHEDTNPGTYVGGVVQYYPGNVSRSLFLMIHSIYDNVV